MNDANVKVETKAGPLNERVNGISKPNFDIPFLNFQGAFRGFAEQGAARAKENFEKMKVASEEMTEVLREAYSTNAKGAADYGAKVIEISSHNTHAALEFLSQLVNSRSVADVVNLATVQSRKNFEAASAQNRELWELARKVATETAGPIKESFNRALRRAA